MNLQKDLVFPSSMILSLFPFQNQINKIRVLIFERKKNHNRQIPKTILHLSYKNFTIQTYFPVSTDENFTKLLPFPHIVPSTLDLNKDLEKWKESDLIELHEKTRIRSEKIYFNVKTQE